jgi:hypothetical protein
MARRVKSSKAKELFAKVPRNVKEWDKAVEKGDLTRHTIHTITGMDSGSKITQTQYLMFRAIWHRRISATSIKLQPLGLDTSVREANLFLDTYTPFQNFLRSMRLGLPIQPHDVHDLQPLGMFEIVRSEQLQMNGAGNATLSQNVTVKTVEAGPSARLRKRKRGGEPPEDEEEDDEEKSDDRVDDDDYSPGAPKTRDEEVYNAAMVSFLQAVSLKKPGVQSKWTVGRARFVCAFGRDRYTAVTDGCLRADSTKKIQAILECKANVRSRV